MYTVADKTRVHDFSLIFLLLDLAVFITKGDVGVGTIVGSAVFNILVIIGICGIFAGQVRTLQSTPCCLTESSVFHVSFLSAAHCSELVASVP